MIFPRVEISLAESSVAVGAQPGGKIIHAVAESSEAAQSPRPLSISVAQPGADKPSGSGKPKEPKGVWRYLTPTVLWIHAGLCWFFGIAIGWAAAQMSNSMFVTKSLVQRQSLSFKLLFDRLAPKKQARTGAKPSAPARKLCVF
jgi:hypothetical protein